VVTLIRVNWAHYSDCRLTNLVIGARAGGGVAAAAAGAASTRTGTGTGAGARQRGALSHVGDLVYRRVIARGGE
jgi:hypothetical protein